MRGAHPGIFASGGGGGGGGGGGLGPTNKNSHMVGFLVLNLFNRSPMVTLTGNYRFPGFQVECHLFFLGGGGGGGGGGLIAYSIWKPI